MPYIADLYHDTEYDMCRESDRMQKKQMEILKKRLKDQKRERMIT